MATESKPNVLIFLCDQLRIDLLNCYQETLVRTPHITDLAGDSCLFERAYTPLRYLLACSRQPAHRPLPPRPPHVQ